MNKPAARISALSLSLMLLAGCATTSLTSTPDSPAQGQALALIEQGKPRDAALQLEGLAAAAWRCPQQRTGRCGLGLAPRR